MSDEFEEPVQLSDLNCTGFTRLKIPTFDCLSECAACSPNANVKKAQAVADTSNPLILSQDWSLPSRQRGLFRPPRMENTHFDWMV